MTVNMSKNKELFKFKISLESGSSRVKKRKER